MTAIERIRNIKILRNEKGASIVLALYFLLICSVLSALIILAGNVAIGVRTSERERNQSEVLAVSCLRIITSEIAGKTYEYNPKESISYFEQNLRSNGVNLMNAYIAEAFETLQKDEEYERNFDIQLTKKDIVISGIFYMNNRYEIRIVINKIQDNGKEISTNKQQIKFYPSQVLLSPEKTSVTIGDAET